MKVVIVSPVIHDERLLAVDDTPDLPKEVAEVLVALGAATPAVNAAKPAEG